MTFTEIDNYIKNNKLERKYNSSFNHRYINSPKTTFYSVEKMDKFIETKNNLSYSNYYQFLSKEFQSEKFNNFKDYLKNIEDVTPTNRGYYIKSNIQPEKLKSFIKNINWNKFGNSSANGGVSWFSKPEFIKIYDENKPI